MTKYLYGAAVQGIQSYIFRTNKLQDIVVASETVQKICTEAFEEFAHGGESIVRAAGNIKYVFDNKSDCEKAVLRFPKKIMQMAPGITFSQAVTELKDEEDFGNAIDRIEKLLKEQRNKLPKSVTAGLMGIKRANNTGLPMETGELEEEEKKEKDKYYGRENATTKLCNKSFGESWRIHGYPAYDVSDMKGKNDWIAVIHADGNGIGQIVQKVKNKEKEKEKFMKFSTQLDKATEYAANITYQKVKEVFLNDKKNKKGVIPIRPVVLSGDDMTVIIRGDLAILYAKTFIVEFENATCNMLAEVFPEGMNHLTACAGIAFIKSSYPFFYGYELAEDLCTQAKKAAKANIAEGRIAESCLMFHKVQDSFINSYSDIEERELTVKAKGDDGIESFKAGPYYTERKDDDSIALKSGTLNLEDCVKKLDGENGDGIKSGIRNWISLRLTDAAKANQRLERMRKVFDKETVKALDALTKEMNNTCIAYDALAYHTIMNQETNS